jgi:hypothetical protein
VKAMVFGLVDCEAVSCATAQPKHPTVPVYNIDHVIMNANKAVFAAALEVPAKEVPAMITDHTQSIDPPPMSAFRRGRTSETQTATQLDRNCNVDEMAVRPKALVCPISSK